jgi:predicted nuclease with TOPRIM domain
MNKKSPIQPIQNTPKPEEELQDEVVLKFLHVLENARAEEMSCSDLYTRLDEFVEREVESKDLAKIAPLVREHLDMCPDCCEEYEALMTVLEHTKEE